MIQQLANTKKREGRAVDGPRPFDNCALADNQIVGALALSLKSVFVSCTEASSAAFAVRSGGNERSTTRLPALPVTTRSLVTTDSAAALS